MRTPGPDHLGDRLGAGREHVRRRQSSPDARSNGWTSPGAPQIYPVFDAERGFDDDGDGDFVFPDDVQDASPDEPALRRRNQDLVGAERGASRRAVGRLFSARDTSIPAGSASTSRSRATEATHGTIDGDDPSEVQATLPLRRQVLRARRRGLLGRQHEGDPPRVAHLAQGGRHRFDRLHLRRREGVVVRVDGDPAAGRHHLRRSPWPRTRSTTRPPSQAMYDAGGILTHGRLPENIDTKAGDNSALPDPRKAQERGQGASRTRPSQIDGFRYQTGGYSAFEGFPETSMRPPLVKPGFGVNFLNTEATLGQPDHDQAWHSITSCKAPCNRGSGIGYPLADGPIKFDSGQLGFGTKGRSRRGLQFQRRGDDRHERVHDPTAHQGRARHTHTSAGSTHSCGDRSARRKRRNDKGKA